MHMLWEYHAERWPLLLADILKSALRAAYLSTSIQDYLALAVEALSSSTEFPKDRQIEIYSNIKNILQVCDDNQICIFLFLAECVILLSLVEKATKSGTRNTRRYEIYRNRKMDYRT